MQRKHCIAALTFLFIPFTHVTAAVASQPAVAVEDTLLVDEDDLVRVLRNVAADAMRKQRRAIDVRTQANAIVRQTESQGTSGLSQRLDRIEYLLSMLAANGATGTRVIQPAPATTIQPAPYMPYNGLKEQLAALDKAKHEQVERLQNQINNLERRISVLAGTVRDRRVKAQMETLSRQFNETATMSNQFTGQQFRNNGMEPALPTSEELATDTLSPEVVTDTVKLTKIEHTGFDTALRQVFFDVSSSQLSTEARKTLADVATILKDNRDLKVELTGFASRDGRAESNRALAERRMSSVKEYLVGQGVSPQQIGHLSFGIDKKSDLKTYGRRVELCISM